MSRVRLLALAAALASLVAALTIGSTRPTRVLPETAPAAEFSAGRALSTLGRLLGDERPHPTGSAENRAFRGRLEAELERLGATVRIQRRTSCGQYGLCAEVENVLAELEGRQRTPAIAIAAHYDSVPAGPGAADDGAGVAAVLELARALRARGPLERSLLLVFTDGEEMGLLGARALVQDAELVRRIGVVVNLEARGVSGPSLMFETSTPNDGLVSAFARSVARPVSGSAFYSVYKRLPNDTDLTVFRRAGLAGVNFAFIGGTAHYHTPSDDLAHLSPASLQHQGDQALALTAELVRHGVPVSRHETVFFDLLGHGLVTLGVPLFRALAVVLLLAAPLLWRRLAGRDGRLRAGAAWAVACCLASLVFSALVAGVLDVLLRARGSLDQPWPANALVIFGAAQLTALATLIATSSWLGRRFDLTSGFFGLWAVELAALALCAAFLPEAGYLCGLPALTATGLSLLFFTRLRPHAAELAALGTLLAHVGIWAPVVGLSFDALGVLAPSLCAVLAALLALPLVPFLAAVPLVTGRRLAAAGGVAALVAGAIAVSGDARSEEAPARVSLAHQLDLDTGRARWLVEAPRLPPELRAFSGFRPNTDDTFPWFGASQVARFQADAPALPAEPPLAELVSERAVSGGRELELELAAADPQALALNLGFPRSQSSVLGVDGQTAVPLAVGDRWVLGVVGPGTRRVRVTVRAAGKRPLLVRVAELRRGLPEAGSRLAELRDGPSTASQTGDVTITSREVRF